MYIGEIIKSYREKNNLSQRAFASRTSLSPSYINTLEKIYNPKTGKPYSVTTDAATEIAKAMFISIEDLLSLLDKNQEFIVNENLHKEKLDELGNPVVEVPLLGVVKAGYNYMAQENWEGMVEVDKYIVKDGSDYFALKIKGDSMSPILIEDDIVIIKKQEDFENGDLVVAIVNGDEATIKKGKKSDSSILLQPLNPSYEPLIFTYDEVKSIPVTIVGIVKQLKREF